MEARKRSPPRRAFPPPLPQALFAPVRNSRTPAWYPAAFAPTRQTLAVLRFHVSRCDFRRTAHQFRRGSTRSWFLSLSSLSLSFSFLLETSKAEKALIKHPGTSPCILPGSVTHCAVLSLPSPFNQNCKVCWEKKQTLPKGSTWKLRHIEDYLSFLQRFEAYKGFIFPFSRVAVFLLTDVLVKL